MTPFGRRSWLRLALVLCAGGAALAACGQKGPLYLPEEREKGKGKGNRSQENPQEGASGSDSG